MRNAIAVLAVILFIFSTASAAPVRTVAVLYLENNSLTQKKTYDGLKKGLCDMLITELAQMSGLKVVERARLEKILSEIAMGQSGVIDESTAPKVGKLLGADILVLGGFMKDMGSSIRIDTRMVKVETGEVLKAEEVTGNPEKLFKLVKKLSFKIADNLSVAVSKDEKKAISAGNQIDMATLLVYSVGLELLDRGQEEAALRKFKEALAMDGSFDRAREMIDTLKEKQ